MNEREDAIEELSGARLRIESLQRLAANPDFQMYLDEVKKLRENYVSLIESPAADTKIDIVRGGLAATKDILNITETLSTRSKQVFQKLAELKEEI